MNSLTIYQKPTCSTCRNVMMRLREAGIEYDAINYITEPPSAQKLAELLKKMNAPARTLLRTTEAEYRELNLDNPSLSDGDIINALVEHPILIQRPILEYGDHAALARPAQQVDAIIEAWKLQQGNTSGST